MGPMIAGLICGSYGLLGAIVGSCEGLNKAVWDATLAPGHILVEVRTGTLRQHPFEHIKLH